MEFPHQNPEGGAEPEVSAGKVGAVEPVESIGCMFFFLFGFGVNLPPRCRISRLHLPIGTKWLYIGTEKGNTHIVHVDSFTLSGYVINWNKAIDP